jgi:hypothetical protein
MSQQGVVPAEREDDSLEKLMKTHPSRRLLLALLSVM